MAIQINSIQPKIGLNIVKCKYTIKQPLGELSIQQPQAQLELKRELPKVSIDQYQCFAEAGLKNNFDFKKECADLGRQAILEGIARRVSEGNMLAHFERGNSVYTIAVSKSNPQHDFNIKFIPTSRPKIEVEGELKINWNINKPIIDYKPNKPIINYEPGKVEIFLRQKGSINVQYIDEKI